MTIPSGVNNHVEMVFRPGELALAMKLLTLLGCEPRSSPFPYQGVFFHFASSERLWISEVTAEQWAFEQWLQRQIAGSDDPSVEAFMGRLGQLPQAHAHFGIGFDTLQEWEDTAARLRDAIATDPDLQGRVSMPVFHRPSDPASVCGKSGGKMGKTLHQCFIRTDIIASGLLTFGQGIEIQHYRENDPGYAGEVARIQESLEA